MKVSSFKTSSDSLLFFTKITKLQFFSTVKIYCSNVPVLAIARAIDYFRDAFTEFTANSVSIANFRSLSVICPLSEENCDCDYPNNSELQLGSFVGRPYTVVRRG